VTKYVVVEHLIVKYREEPLPVLKSDIIGPTIVQQPNIVGNDTSTKADDVCMTTLHKGR
jgi:hypothetical protein